jgi:hypothetical protein
LNNKEASIVDFLGLSHRTHRSSVLDAEGVGRVPRKFLVCELRERQIRIIVGEPRDVRARNHELSNHGLHFFFDGIQRVSQALLPLRRHVKFHVPVFQVNSATVRCATSANSGVEQCTAVPSSIAVACKGLLHDILADKGESLPKVDVVRIKCTSWRGGSWVVAWWVQHDSGKEGSKVLFNLHLANDLLFDLLVGHSAESHAVSRIEESLLIDGSWYVPQPNNSDHGLPKDDRRAEADSDISPVFDVSQNTLPKIGAGAEEVRLNVAANAWHGLQGFCGLEQAEGVIDQCFVTRKEDRIDVAHATKEIIVDVEIIGAVLKINGVEVENGLFGR